MITSKDLQLAISTLTTLEKGGKKAQIGEIRNFAGRPHIKTANGWKFYGKGTGKKAASHKEPITSQIQFNIISEKEFEDIIELGPEFGAPNYTKSELLNGEKFNTGFCDVFAYYMESVKGGYQSHDYYDFKDLIHKDKIVDNDVIRFPEHAFVSKTVKGKQMFFDIEEQQGVGSPLKLPFYKRFKQKNGK